VRQRLDFTTLRRCLFSVIFQLTDYFQMESRSCRGRQKARRRNAARSLITQSAYTQQQQQQIGSPGATDHAAIWPIDFKSPDDIAARQWAWRHGCQSPTLPPMRSQHGRLTYLQVHPIRSRLWTYRDATRHGVSCDYQANVNDREWERERRMTVRCTTMNEDRTGQLDHMTRKNV